MEKKSIAIIGAGLSGCAAAIYLNKLGHKVTIYEKEKKLGGVAKDLVFEDNIYFNGPNYLDPDSLLINLLKKESFFNEIIEMKEISYGSYTDIFNDKVVSKKFAHPISLNKLIINKKKIKSQSLLERINLYSPNERKALISWGKKFGYDISKLHKNCSHLMGFGRIFYKNEEKKILDLKKKSNIYDEILAIPNFKKANKICIPINGFNFFFKRLEKYFHKNAIDFKLQSKINIIKDNNKIYFNCSEKRIKADFFILASNPIPLLRGLNFKKLDNPAAKFELVVCDVENCNKKFENFYI